MFKLKPLKLYKRQGIEPGEIVRRLVEINYSREPFASAQGMFCLKGDVLDIFPYTFDFPIRVFWDFDEISRISTFNPDNGGLLWDYEAVVILPKRSHYKSPRLSDPAKLDELPIYNFLDFREGDYVVHTHYGIAIYRGIKKVKYKDRGEDSLILEYRDGKVLYVPVSHSHLVQRFIGGRGKIALSVLGSKEWQKAKERVRRGAYRMAIEMVKLQALRMSLRGFAFKGDSDIEREFANGFAFEETNDQIKAIEDILRDMASPRPMDRLLCGEVGYGKTEVAMRAALRCALCGKQAALLVPTTLLAEQHFCTFTERFGPFPVQIEMFSRFKSKAEQKEILDKLSGGRIDIIIGTHRLLSKDVVFKDLGLLIIDEEQRFGVRHKERMKSFRALVDVLTMTATPIPRTLYMSLMGIKDISLLQTPPKQRLAVETRVVKFDYDMVKQAIENELRRGGQVFFLHNKVHTIEKRAQSIRRLAPEARVAVAHGQMPPGELEKVMVDFIKGDVDVLVCTVIIESGIDIKNANTLIIERADLFGLAELHQLRGRVGRYNRQAYAYFCLPAEDAMTEDARKRLNAIERYSELGAGFHLAMEDLEIRGAGNILGAQQHGYIASVGFDMYTRILNQVVAQVKKEFSFG